MLFRWGVIFAEVEPYYEDGYVQVTPQGSIQKYGAIKEGGQPDTLAMPGPAYFTGFAVHGNALVTLVDATSRQEATFSLSAVPAQNPTFWWNEQHTAAAIKWKVADQQYNVALWSFEYGSQDMFTSAVYDVNSQAWSPDGAVVAIKYKSDATHRGVKIWDTQTNEVYTLFDRVYDVHQMVWNPQGTHIAVEYTPTTSNERQVAICNRRSQQIEGYMFDVDNEPQLSKLPKINDRYWSADGMHLGIKYQVEGVGRNYRVWSIGQQQTHGTDVVDPLPTDVHNPGWSVQGSYFAARFTQVTDDTEYKNMLVWDPILGSSAFLFDQGVADISDPVWNPQMLQYIFSYRVQKDSAWKIAAWSPDGGLQHVTFSGSASSVHMSGAVWNAQGRYCMFVWQDEESAYRLAVWDAKHYTMQILDFSRSGYIGQLTWDPTGRYCLLYSTTEMVVVDAARNWQEYQVFFDGTGVRFPQWSVDGRYVAFQYGGTGAENVFVWDTVAEQGANVFDPSVLEVKTYAWSSTQPCLAVGWKVSNKNFSAGVWDGQSESVSAAQLTDAYNLGLFHWNAAGSHVAVSYQTSASTHNVWVCSTQEDAGQAILDSDNGNILTVAWNRLGNALWVADTSSVKMWWHVQDAYAVGENVIIQDVAFDQQGNQYVLAQVALADSANANNLAYVLVKLDVLGRLVTDFGEDGMVHDENTFSQVYQPHTVAVDDQQVTVFFKQTNWQIMAMRYDKNDGSAGSSFDVDADFLGVGVLAQGLQGVVYKDDINVGVHQVGDNGPLASATYTDLGLENVDVQKGGIYQKGNIIFVVGVYASDNLVILKTDGNLQMHTTFGQNGKVMQSGYTGWQILDLLYDEQTGSVYVALQNADNTMQRIVAYDETGSLVQDFGVSGVFETSHSEVTWMDMQIAGTMLYLVGLNNEQEVVQNAVPILSGWTIINDSDRMVGLGYANTVLMQLKPGEQYQGPVPEGVHIIEVGQSVVATIEGYRNYRVLRIVTNGSTGQLALRTGVNEQDSAQFFHQALVRNFQQRVMRAGVGKLLPAVVRAESVCESEYVGPVVSGYQVYKK